MTRAFVAFGSNLGDREDAIRAALAELAAAEGVEVEAVSTLIETDPVGFLEQPRFVNGVAEVRTSLSARGLLDLLLAIEARLGRDRSAVPPQGPRTIDLDLLLYGGEQLDEPGLAVPHPRLAERAFVLQPLAELDPALEVPGKGPIQTLLAGLD